MVDITFKTQTCFGEPNPLLTPMRVIKASKKKIPKSCTWSFQIFCMGSNGCVF